MYINKIFILLAIDAELSEREIGSTLTRKKKNKKIEIAFNAFSFRGNTNLTALLNAKELSKKVELVSTFELRILRRRITDGFQR